MPASENRSSSDGPPTPAAPIDDGWLRDLGLSGSAAFLGILLTLATFLMIRPPTVGELERDIWETWANLSTAEQNLTLVDLVAEGRRPAAERFLAARGEEVSRIGGELVVHTQVRYFGLFEPDTETAFAEWRSPRAADFDATTAPTWRDCVVPLRGPADQVVGWLRVEYKFYREDGLEGLPNVARLRTLYGIALAVAGLLGLVVLAAVLTNVARLRERAGRLRSQQLTLDLAHQMCHELRNGLWAFSMEARNVQRLFDLVDEFAQAEPEALQQAMTRVGLDETARRRLERSFHRHLAASNVDPATDLVPSNHLAREAHRQLESFSRYINLTVEELDRNLLGAAGWEPKPLRASAAWTEAVALLRLRFRSAGVTHEESLETADDWVLADHRAIVHVFVNLAKNAIEAMREAPGERVLRVAIRSGPGPSVRIEMRNSGPPIPPENLPHLFRRGFSTKAGAGRGHGLTLVYESVGRMGGSISVSSSADEGTLFRIDLPATPAPGDAPDPALAGTA